MLQNSWFEISKNPKGAVIKLRGRWRAHQIAEMTEALSVLNLPGGSRVILDQSALEEIDSTGVMVLLKRLNALGIEESQIDLSSFPEGDRRLFELVQIALDRPHMLQPDTGLTPLENVGYSALKWWSICFKILEFIGRSLKAVVEELSHPLKMRWKDLVVHFEHACVDALPIVALVTFLIGIVVAYLSGVQTQKFGANIFIVDGVGLAFCRELSPILAAILVAGRSGSSFTAQLGAMKLNDEIDAIQALGLSELKVLVVPRLLALMIAMPILVFVGDVCGILGSMMIADLRLGISAHTFIERLREVLQMKSVLVGLFKAPVFAAFVATISCQMGLVTKRNARSIGLSTTSTVVQSIVAVILLNAAFAIILVELGI